MHSNEQQSKASDDSATGCGPPAKRFVVKKWHNVALWAWDIVDDICRICCNHIMDPCIECQATHSANNGKDCVVAWGSCGHAFHLHCISRWLRTRFVCPLDNLDWKFDMDASNLNSN